jgi:hypothetical protein
MTAQSNVATAPQEPPAKQEVTLYQDRGVTVTSHRLIVLGESYILSHVTSVSSIYTRSIPSIIFGVLLLFISFPILIAGLTLFLSDRIQFGPFLLGVGLFAIGILFVLAGRPVYYLVVGTAGAEKRAIKDRSNERISKIVGIVNQAVIARNW